MTLSRKIAQTVIEQSVGATTLLEVLSKYRLESLMPSVVVEMKKILRAQGETTALRIETPFPLNDTSLAHIVSLTHAEGAPVIQTCNEHVLAGFKARYQGKLYDGSAERIIHLLTR